MRISAGEAFPHDLKHKSLEGYSVQAKEQVIACGLKNWIRRGEFTTLEEAKKERDFALQFHDECRIVWFSYKEI